MHNIMIKKMYNASYEILNIQNKLETGFRESIQSLTFILQIYNIVLNLH